jgi:hypothetical protein
MKHLALLIGIALVASNARFLQTDPTANTTTPADNTTTPPIVEVDYPTYDC